MLFNHVDYEKKLAEMSQVLLRETDQVWREDLDLRYSQFLIKQAARALVAVSVDLPGAYAGFKGAEALNAARQNIANVQTQIAMATAVISGHLAIKAPHTAEATLRLFDEATHPYERAGVPVAFKCKASAPTDPPQDCAWPVCGCDAYAVKVVESLREQGLVEQ